LSGDDVSSRRFGSPMDEPLPPPNQNDVLNESMRAFLTDGFPHLDDAFAELHRYRPQMPKELEVILFHVVGRYMHALNNAMLEYDLDAVTACSSALNAVMGDPIVASYIQQALSDGVTGAVRRTFEGN